jgi:hypothetical protein
MERPLSETEKKKVRVGATLPGDDGSITAQDRTGSRGSGRTRRRDRDGAHGRLATPATGSQWMRLLREHHTSNCAKPGNAAPRPPRQKGDTKVTESISDGN